MSDYVRWNYKYGETYINLLDTDMPPDIFEEQECAKQLPEVHQILEQPYIDAFYILHGSRRSAQGVGKIPLSEILIFYDHFPLGDKEDFVFIMQQADNAYVKSFYDDSKNKPPKPDQ